MKRIFLALALWLLPLAAFAQTSWQTPGQQLVPGMVQMCLNSASQAVPCGSGGGYPAGAVSVGNAFSGADTTSAAATLPSAAGKTTYICGFTVSGLGATGATTVNVTVATLVGGTSPTYSYVFPAGAGAVATSVNVTYSPCIPSNTAASTIVVTVPGAAGNTATQINAWGYQF